MDVSSINQLGRVQQTGEVRQYPTGLGGTQQEQAIAGGEEDKKVSKADLQKEIDNLNKFIQTSNTHLKFTLHEGLQEYFVQIIDDRTNEVVREVPSSKILDLAAKIHEMIGILVDEKR
jgi:flagellar protein FlaG